MPSASNDELMVFGGGNAAARRDARASVLLDADEVLRSDSLPAGVRAHRLERRRRWEVCLPLPGLIVPP